jgi:hypothetical protein
MPHRADLARCSRAARQAVQDSIIVQRDKETPARETLSALYKATTGATPRITTAITLVVAGTGDGW